MRPAADRRRLAQIGRQVLHFVTGVLRLSAGLPRLVEHASKSFQINHLSPPR